MRSSDVLWHLRRSGIAVLCQAKSVRESRSTYPLRSSHFHLSSICVFDLFELAFQSPTSCFAVQCSVLRVGISHLRVGLQCSASSSSWQLGSVPGDQSDGRRLAAVGSEHLVQTETISSLQLRPVSATGVSGLLLTFLSVHFYDGSYQ